MFVDRLLALLFVAFGLLQATYGVVDSSAEFHRADKNGDEVITAAEFRVFMMGDGLSAKEVNQFFTEFDQNGDGKISRAENDAVFKKWADEYKKQLQQYFQTTDTNKDGRLSLDEVIVLTRQQDETDSDAQLVFNNVDKDKDNVISNDEFMNYEWEMEYDDD